MGFGGISVWQLLIILAIIILILLYRPQGIFGQKERIS